MHACNDQQYKLDGYFLFGKGQSERSTADAYISFGHCVYSIQTLILCEENEGTYRMKEEFQNVGHGGGTINTEGDLALMRFLYSKFPWSELFYLYVIKQGYIQTCEQQPKRVSTLVRSLLQGTGDFFLLFKLVPRFVYERRRSQSERLQISRQKTHNIAF